MAPKSEKNGGSRTPGKLKDIVRDIPSFLSIEESKALESSLKSFLKRKDLKPVATCQVDSRTLRLGTLVGGVLKHCSSDADLTGFEQEGGTKWAILAANMKLPEKNAAKLCKAFYRRDLCLQEFCLEQLRQRDKQDGREKRAATGTEMASTPAAADKSAARKAGTSAKKTPGSQKLKLTHNAGAGSMKLTLTPHTGSRKIRKDSEVTTNDYASRLAEAARSPVEEEEDVEMAEGQQHIANGVGEGAGAVVANGAGGSRDWALELLLVQHEALRLDLSEMEQLLAPEYFTGLEKWKVTAFITWYSEWFRPLAESVLSFEETTLLAMCVKHVGEGALPEALTQKAIDKLYNLLVDVEEEIDNAFQEADRTDDPDKVRQAAAHWLRERVTAVGAQLRAYMEALEGFAPQILRQNSNEQAAHELLKEALSGPNVHRQSMFPWVLHAAMKWASPAKVAEIYGLLSYAQKHSCKGKWQRDLNEARRKLWSITLDEQPKGEPTRLCVIS